MSSRLTRQQFLRTAGIALVSLAVVQACVPSDDKPQPARTPARAGCCSSPRVQGEERAPTPTPTATAAATPTPEPSPTVEPTPPPVASSISRPPAPEPTATPTPTPTPLPADAALAQEAQRRYGVNIVLDGQEWGTDLNNRLANIQAAIDALARLPASVVAAITVQHPHGPLYLLSNNHGRTLAGWQPYGDFPIGFYTNSDHDPRLGSVIPSNQVVLIPGFAHASIGHELLHAYQFRGVAPDRYGLAVLGDEMKGFIQAVGWVQLGSDDEVREASRPDSSWADFNALFQYQGRQLTYSTEGGDTFTLNPANPLEGYALAGSFYYTRPSWIPQPDWPEYWSWFRANLG